MTFDIEELTISVEQAGVLLGISRGLAYQLAGKGELPGVHRLGKRYVVSIPQLKEYLGLKTNAEEMVGKENPAKVFFTAPQLKGRKE